MTSKQQGFLCLAILVLFSMLLLILFGDHGVADLNLLKSERDALVETNEKLARENLLVYDKINRLKTDLEYIENVARQEFGMIGEDELILKPRSSDKSQ